MIPVSSSIANKEAAYPELCKLLSSQEFALGGNWEYDHGYFDRYLDQEHMVWVRIPFKVTGGNFEGDCAASNATIRLEQPFVLKHVYNEGLDLKADAMVYKALVDQFQSPVDPDAPVESHWVNEAKNVLKRVEAELL